MSEQASDSETDGRAEATTESWAETITTSRSVTDQPGTRHHPFLEPTPVYWDLQERRWQAAELLMRQPVGHCFFLSASGEFGPVTIPKPREIYIHPGVVLRFTQQRYQKYCLTREQAEQAIAERQQRRFHDLPSLARSGLTLLSTGHRPAPPDVPEPPARAIWTRVSPPSPHGPSMFARPGSRGPRPDRENQLKVAEIVERFGDGWSSDEVLADVCDALDTAGVSVPKTWPRRKEGKAKSWSRARQYYPALVVKAVKDRLKALRENSREFPPDE